MILSDLKINCVRNIASMHLRLNSRFNIITGSNGSGKTSILEALYFLSSGRSFRTREISPIIMHSEKNLTVFAKGFDNSSISVQKSCSDLTQIKLNNQMCSSTSQLAYALPCQIFYSDIFQIIDAGPTVRRSVLDWGLFHVKPSFLAVWKEYKRVLKQRNSLLRQKASYEQFIPWDLQLSALGNELHMLREDYFSVWVVKFREVLAQLTNSSCELSYYKGWDRKNSGKSLVEILEDSFVNDCQRLYTQYGAHQADILIESSDTKAKHFLSRGQQKVILIALKLSQAALLNTECLYLFDDFSAELDEEHVERLVAYLASTQGQYVITTLKPIDSNLLSSNDIMYSVIKNGALIQESSSVCFT